MRMPDDRDYGLLSSRCYDGLTIVAHVIRHRGVALYRWLEDEANNEAGKAQMVEQKVVIDQKDDKQTYHGQGMLSSFPQEERTQ